MGKGSMRWTMVDGGQQPKTADRFTETNDPRWAWSMPIASIRVAKKKRYPA